MKYKPVIGLEIHVELKTKTKMFCDSLNDPDEKHPNINVCPICMGHPGTLPVINEDAVRKVIMAGLALNCKIAEDTFFERKNYFYPDLPKGYQISQYQKPLCYGGYLDLLVANRLQSTDYGKKNSSSRSAVDSKRIRITRIHLEEDAGRLYHLPDKDLAPSLSADPRFARGFGEASRHSEKGRVWGGASYSLVDFNRAGVPLMELVTEPDLENGQEVRKFAEELQLILRYLNVSDADMEKGQMRIEVNISLMQTVDSKQFTHSGSQLAVDRRLVLGTKVEIKNINSIKFAVDAVDYEIKRQTELLEAGEKIIQETRGWSEIKKQTFSQRSKEEAQDYRYFPEPDLPLLRIARGRASLVLLEQGEPPAIDFFVDEIKSQLPELPQQRKERFARQYGLPNRDIEILTVNKLLGDYYEHVVSELDSAVKDIHFKRGLQDDNPSKPHILDRLHLIAANYMITEFPALLNAWGSEINELEGFKISPEAFAELMVLIFHKELSSTAAKTVLKEMAQTGIHPEQIMREKDLGQVSNIDELETAVEKVIVDNPKAVEDYKKGKEASLKFLIGMAMRETKGKANPQVVEQIITQKLKWSKNIKG